MTEHNEITVCRDDARGRYEAVLDGTVVGRVEFRREPRRVVLVHTRTDPAYEGRGIGSALARGALDDIRAHAETAVVECPFIAEYVRRHPEYQDHVSLAAD